LSHRALSQFFYVTALHNHAHYGIALHGEHRASLCSPARSMPLSALLSAVDFLYLSVVGRWHIISKKSFLEVASLCHAACRMQQAARHSFAPLSSYAPRVARLGVSYKAP